MTTYRAFNRYNRLVFTFNAPDLAAKYQDRMASIGCEITIRPSPLTVTETERVIRRDRRAA